MKFGLRKPSVKKSFKARTTGKLKRQAKRAINPFYGKKGMGWFRNPKKALYNKVYKKNTISFWTYLRNVNCYLSFQLTCNDNSSLQL